LQPWAKQKYEPPKTEEVIVKSILEEESLNL
jgi:hypothetical protein